MKHLVFPQRVTSALFGGNMLRARKYRFALCFRVLSNQYVERSAYANVFKFNKEKKCLERAKVNSRWPHLFPAAMHVGVHPSEGLQHGVSILNTIIFSDTFCRITRARNITYPRNFGTFICYSSAIFQLPDSIYWMVSDFIFHLHDNQACVSGIWVILSLILVMFIFSFHTLVYCSHT